MPDRIRIGKLHMADIVFGALALSAGAMALIGYSTAGDDVLRVLLWPHAKAVEIFYHISLFYQNGVGYSANGFAIGAACMGMNFIVMLFCLMACVFTRRFHGFHKAAFFMSSLAGSVVVGVLVSCIRIIGSVPFLSSGHFTTLHACTGITLYLVTLVGSYVLINKATGDIYEKHS